MQDCGVTIYNDHPAKSLCLFAKLLYRRYQRCDQTNSSKKRC